MNLFAKIFKRIDDEKDFIAEIPQKGLYNAIRDNFPEDEAKAMIKERKGMMQAHRSIVESDGETMEEYRIRIKEENRIEEEERKETIESNWWQHQNQRGARPFKTKPLGWD